MKPLENLDFLIRDRKQQTTVDKARGPSVTESPLDEATVVYGGQILRSLKDAGGSLDAFQIVEKTDVPLETLFQILDTLSSKFQWVEVDRSDRRGNYHVELTQGGKEYLIKAGMK